MDPTPTPHDITRVYTPDPGGRGHSAPKPTAPKPGAEGPGTRVGPYLLLQPIGEGGMGAVFLAEQEHPVRRRVALKLIKGGMDSAQIVARFEAERQALALMDHLNIARVLDAGAMESGRPYFVMELVHGGPITKYCDANRLTPRQRLELFVPVCQAIQHAHLKGIIHRDIKPSNVLVTLCDGRPVPKVIDFGVAKAVEQPLTDRTMFTVQGAVIGTLEYMSPEQAELSAQGVDTRSDIYSLGVLLYELLTGTTPLEWKDEPSTGFADRLRMIREVEPARPSARLSSLDALAEIAAARTTEPRKLKRLVRGELDWVVMKCLEKDPSRRYETAGGLARDVERFLADEPVEAGPPSAAYRLRRFARKHRRSLAAAVLCALALLAGVAVSSWQALRATRAERRERDAARQMQAQRDLARRALTRQVAERMDGDLRRLALAAQVMASTVAQRADWREDQLERWMRTVMEKDDRIFALNVGFEPGRFEAGRDDYCLYVYRGPQGIRKKHLLPPAYLPLYREWDWYTRPRAEQRALWSEPYVDTGGGDVPMVTYTVPLLRRGEFIGVLSLDLSVQYFEVLRGWLTELNLGEQSYGFVISPAGLIISHPHPAYDFARLVAADQAPRTLAGLGRGDASFAALARRIQQARSGGGTAVDPASGRPAAFLFAPVTSAGWTFVAVIEGM